MHMYILLKKRPWVWEGVVGTGVGGQKGGNNVARVHMWNCQKYKVFE